MKREGIGWFRRAAAVCLGGALVLSGLAAGSASAVDRVLMTNWIPEGTAAPVFHALEKGWFKGEGIDLRIVRGYGSNSTASAVSEGKAHFGYGDTSAIILVRAKGADAKIVGLFMDKSPVGLGSLAPLPLRAPKDLEGRSIGLSPFTITRQLLTILAAKNGVDSSRIKIVTTQPGVEITQFLAGKLEIVDMWDASSREIATLKAEKAGRKVNYLSFRNFGLDIYSLTFWAKGATLQREPQWVRGFLKAAYRGFAATRTDRQAAYASLMKHHPALDKEVTRRQVDTLVDVLVDWPRWDRAGAGVIEEAKMKLTLDTVREGFKVQAAMSAKDLYTNDFLPGKK